MAPGDADPTAPTYGAEPNAIKLSFSTGTSPVTYSGAALNGAVGASSFATPRPFLAKASGPAASFPAGATLTVRGVTELGIKATAVLVLDVATSPAIFTTLEEFTSILEVSIDPLLPGGSLELGLGARAGCGSIVLAVAGLEALDVLRWQSRALPLRIGDGAQVQNYDALVVTLRTRELLCRDNDAEFAAFADAKGGAAGTLDLTNGEGAGLESDSYEF